MLFLLVILSEVIAIFLFAALSAWVVNRREDRFEKQCAALFSSWRKAKKERELWLTEHSYTRDPFTGEEYESLWNTEIGAEAILNTQCGSSSFGSYEEYRREQAKRDIQT